MFPCTGCGLCCQNIATVKELKEFDLGNGVCKFFDIKTNNCMIYESRPDICKVDKMFNIKYNNEFSKKEFYKLNAKVCNDIQEKYHLNISYRIKIGE
jgi:Fe-S-cluster containining protein